MGRKRKPEEEKIGTISINLRNSILYKIAEEGEPKKIIEKIITDIYGKK